MKYDPEYNSYRFDTTDTSTIVNALYFYHQHSPILDEDRRDYIMSLIKDLQNPLHNRINSHI